MKTGERYRFKGIISKCEKTKNAKKSSVLVVDLEDDQGRSITDFVWIDLHVPYDLEAVKQSEHISFEAKIKRFQPNSYYDYHERERVALRPTLELSEISEIVIK